MSYAEYVESCVQVSAKELAELRAIKLLAKEYMAAVLEHGKFHHERGQRSNEQSWNKKHEVLRKNKLAAGKALFVALEKED